LPKRRRPRILAPTARAEADRKGRARNRIARHDMVTEAQFPPAARAAGARASGRIEALDVLRGVAILGILFMNIVPMGMGDAAMLPWALAETRADWAYWWFSGLFLQGTQRGLLELLFGAGMVILTARATRPDAPVAIADVYYRRTLFLTVFGLVLGTLLLFPGEILFVYGLAGLALFPLRNLPPRALLLAGSAGLLAITLAMGVPRYVERARLVETVAAAQAKQAAGAAPSAAEKAALEKWAELGKNLKVDEAALAKEREQRLGGYASNLAWSTELYARFNSGAELLRGVIEAFSVMLIGAALLKLGVLGGDRPARFYLLLMLGGYALGLPLRYAEAAPFVEPTLEPRLGSLTYDLSRLATSLGHVGAVCLLLKSATGARAMRPIAAAGRMAFTTYLGQTLILQWLLFPGFALGLWGRFGLAELGAIALAIGVAQVLFAVAWLRAYRMGPFEWAWRSLTYLERQPMRRSSAPGAPAPAE